MERPTILKCCKPNGMPMMVTQYRKPTTKYTSEIKNPPNKNQRMLPKYFIMTIKLSYPKISLAIAFTLSTSIGLRMISSGSRSKRNCI